MRRRPQDPATRPAGCNSYRFRHAPEGEFHSGEVAGGREAPIGNANFDYIDPAGDADFDQQLGHGRAFVQFNPGDHFNDPIWKEMHDTGHAVNGCPNPCKDGGRGSSAHAGSP